MDDDEAKPNPSAFVSWAHGDADWEFSVFAFVSLLRDLGIDADVDLFHLHDTDIDWTTYGTQGIVANDFVIVATSPSYRERWEGLNDPTVGAGAAREANVLKTIFNQNQATFRRKMKVVLLPGVDDGDIPLELAAATQHFRIRAVDNAGVDDLVRTLTRQPRYPMNPVAAVPVLGSKVRGAEYPAGTASSHDPADPAPSHSPRRLSRSGARPGLERDIEALLRRGLGELKGGRLPAAADTFAQVVVASNEAGLVANASAAKSNRAVALARCGAYDDAEQVMEGLLHDSTSTAAVKSLVRVNLGALAARRRRLDSALEYLSAGLHDATSSSYGVLQSITMINLGVTRLLGGDWVEAMKGFERASLLAQRSSDTESLARAYNNAGVARCCRGELEDGIPYLEQAFELARTSSNSPLTISTLNNLVLETEKHRLEPATSLRDSLATILRANPEYQEHLGHDAEVVDVAGRLDVEAVGPTRGKPWPALLATFAFALAPLALDSRR